MVKIATSVKTPPLREAGTGPYVLVVDDEASALSSSQRMLHAGGIASVLCCQDSREVLGLLRDQPVDVVLLDLSMPHIGGQELLAQIAEEHPDIPVIIVTGFNQIDVAVACMRDGAFGYMVKPAEKSRLVSGVQRALEVRALRQECGQLRERMLSRELEQPEAFAHIITNDTTMDALFRYVETAAATSRPVLITGETGVGKRNSSPKPFIR